MSWTKLLHVHLHFIFRRPAIHGNVLQSNCYHWPTVNCMEMENDCYTFCLHLVNKKIRKLTPPPPSVSCISLWDLHFTARLATEITLQSKVLPHIQKCFLKWELEM